MPSQHNVTLFALLAPILLLAACSHRAVGEDHHTVTWYQQHPVEQRQKVQWCADDMARQKDYDCQNAKQALVANFYSDASPQPTPSPVNDPKALSIAQRFDPAYVNHGAYGYFYDASNTTIVVADWWSNFHSNDCGSQDRTPWEHDQHYYRTPCGRYTILIRI